MSTLPPVAIIGVGAVTPLGRDLQAVTRAIGQAADENLGNTPRRVADDLLTDAAMGKHLRRADRFTRMAAVAALDAWNSAAKAAAPVAPERVGMIITSGFGPHCRGFRFLDGMLDSGDAAASPTDFSHSVHGVAAAYVSGLLELRGPAMNSTDFELGFEQAVLLAQCWLDEGACDRILIGAIEELGEVMLHCVPRMTEGRTPLTPGEGAVFLVLDRAGSGRAMTLDAATTPQSVDLLVVEDPPIIPAQLPRRIVARQTKSFTPHFGHSASGSAFAILGGLLTMNNEPAIDTAATFRTTSEMRATTLTLRTPAHG